MFTTVADIECNRGEVQLEFIQMKIQGYMRSSLESYGLQSCAKKADEIWTIRRQSRLLDRYISSHCGVVA